MKQLQLKKEFLTSQTVRLPESKDAVKVKVNSNCMNVSKRTTAFIPEPVTRTCSVKNLKQISKKKLLSVDRVPAKVFSTEFCEILKNNVLPLFKQFPLILSKLFKIQERIETKGNIEMNWVTLREMWLYSELFWSECGKILTRKTPNTDTFHAV